MAVLRCEHCGLPWARVQNGCIIVVSTHRGEKHVNAISIAKLLEMVESGDTQIARFCGKIGQENRIS